MKTTDELTDQEHEILAFVKGYLEKSRMFNALAMVNNPRTALADLRALIKYYHSLYQRERMH